MKYRVRWIEPCTYQLMHRRTRRGTPKRPWNDTDTITVHINEVREDGFAYRLTSTFSSDTLSGTMDRVVLTPHRGVISLGF